MKSFCIALRMHQIPYLFFFLFMINVQVYEGVFHHRWPIRTDIIPALEARYVNVTIVSYYSQPALLMELYGCPVGGYTSAYGCSW